MAIFTIAPVNSISFVRVNSLLENFENTLHHELTGVLNKEPYHQRVVTGETIALQIKTDYDTITAQVYNILTNTYTSLTVTLAATFTGFSFHEVAFTVSAAGFYKVFITGTKSGYSTVNIVSELIEARASWEGVKIEYYNSANTSYVDYATGLTHLLRVGGTVRFSDVGGKDEFYNNLGSEERIYSENETIDELTIEAIPYYLAKKIIYGSRLDTFKVNDLEYVVKEHSITPHNGSHSFDLTLKLTQKEVYGINDDFEPDEQAINVKYGYRYNWFAVNDSRNIAATGAHVLTQTEWQALQTYLGGPSVAGGKLKETGTAYWIPPNTGATNEVLFAARGSGIRDETGAFISITESEVFWANTEYDASNAIYTLLAYDSATMLCTINGPKEYGASVRVAKDSTTLSHLQTGWYYGNDNKKYLTVCINGVEYVVLNICETKYRNGDLIPEVTDGSAWAALSTGARCSYDNDETNAFSTSEVPAGGSPSADSTTVSADDTNVTADGI